MSRLAVLSNPASGGNGAGLDRMRAAAQAAGIRHVSVDDPGGLPELLRDLAGEGVELLAVNGGDGTLVAVISALRNHAPFAREPALAVLPGGTTNMVAGDVGVAGPPDQGLRRLAAACADGVPVSALHTRRPLVLRRGDEPARYGFFFATAAVPRIIRRTRQRLHSRGLTGPVGEAMALGWSLLRLAAGRVASHPVLHPDPVRFAIDDEAWQERQTVLFFAATLERLLLGLRPMAPGRGLGLTGLFLPCRGLWYRLPGLLSGRGPASLRDGVLRAEAKRVRLTTPAELVLDGEFLGADAERPVLIEAGAPLGFLAA